MAGSRTEIRGFRGEYYFLSNFSNSPFTITFDGVTYTMLTGEHGFHAAKFACMISGDPHAFLQKMSQASTPGKAKSLGRSIKIDVAKWNSISFRCMERVVELKFDQNPDLAQNLIETNPALLVEENDWGDQLWGTVKGEGKNQLGLILMSRRQALLTQNSSD